MTDADVLGAATGQRPDAVCPPHRWLPLPMAPPMAADALGRPPFTIADLVAEVRRPTMPTSCFVESAGGVRSPLAADGDTVTLADACAPALVVLVADAGLGTINAVRLARRRARRARPRRRAPQPLRRRRRPAPPQPRLARARERASRSSPTPRPSRIA